MFNLCKEINKFSFKHGKLGLIFRLESVFIEQNCLSFSKYFQKYNDNHFLFMYTFFFFKKKFYKLLLNQVSLFGYGLFSSYLYKYVDSIVLSWRWLRFLKCTPVRSFRSKNNAKTTQLKLKNVSSVLISIIGLRRRTLKERAALFKKKLKIVRTKKKVLKKVKKGPVIRSRDSKKSVWR